MEPSSCDFAGTASLLCEECICKLKTNTTAKLNSIITFICNQPRFDCSPIHPGGDHYEPNTLFDHAAWAVNEWYLEHFWSVESCDFAGDAFLSPRVCKDGPSD